MNIAARTAAILFAGLLLAAPLPAFAQVCETLAKVVSAASENPPFNSVRYFDLPNATCSVGSYYQFKHAWQCELRLELGSKEAEINNINQQRRNLRRMVENLQDEYFDTDSRQRKDEINREVLRLTGYKACCGEDVVKLRRWEYGYARDHDDWEGEYGNLAVQEYDILRPLKSEMTTRVRKLLSTIQQCEFDGKLPGTWDNFWDYTFNSNNDKWDASQICNATLCIEVATPRSSANLTATIAVRLPTTDDD